MEHFYNKGSVGDQEGEGGNEEEAGNEVQEGRVLRGCGTSG